MVVKKLLLGIFCILLLSSFTLATINDDTTSYYKLDINSGSQLDSVAGLNNGTVSGAAFTSDGFINGAYRFSGVAQHIDVGDSAFDIGTGNATWGFIINSTSVGTECVLCKWAGAGTKAPAIWFSAGTFYAQVRDGSNEASVSIASATILDGNYHKVILTKNGTTVNLYVDGSLRASTSNSALGNTDNNIQLDISSYDSGTAWGLTNTAVDEVFVAVGTAFSADDVLVVNNSYNLGFQYPFNIPVGVVNESTESVVLDRQVGSVSIAGGGFQLVQSVTFNVSVNDTPTYFSNVYEVSKSAGGDAQLECNFLVDSVPVLNINRTISAGEFGNVYMVTQNVSLDNGSHTADTECQRASGSGSIQLAKGVMMGHLMTDENNNILNNQFFTFNFSNLNDSFIELDEFNFTVSNFTSGTSVVGSVIVDWSANYEYVTTGNITTMLQIDGVNCSEFQIGASAGDSRVAGAVCGVENVTPNTDVNIKIFGRDSGGLAFMNIFVKEVLLEDQELLFGEGILTGTNITFSTLTNIGIFHLENVDKANVDLSGQVGLAIKSLDGVTNLSFQARVNGTKALNSSVYFRTVDENGGAVVLQDLLQDAPIGSYDLSLFVACSNANCTITGSNGLAFFTDIVTEVFNGFNVTGTNFWDNSSIDDFNVSTSSGSIFSSVGGTAFVLSNLLLDNLSIFDSTFFPLNFSLHNTSLDLNVSLKQSQINFSSLELITNNVLFPVNYSVDGRDFSSVFFPSIGSHNVTASRNGYFNLTQVFNVSALQNSTVAVDGLFNLLTNVTVTNFVLNTSIQNFSGVYSNVANLFVDAFSTTVASVLLPMIQGLAYNIQLDTILGFASTGNSFNLSVVNTTGVNNLSVNFELFTNNSISFNVFNLSDLSLMSQRVNISLVGSTVTVNTNTSNGILFLDGLNDDTYTITFKSGGFDNTVLFATVAGSSHQFVNAFMSDSLDPKTFTVISDFGNAVPDATLTFLQNINGSLITIAQGMTDFSGVAVVNLDPAIEYSFFVTADGFDTFTGTIVPIASAFTVTLTTSGIDRFISVFEDVIFFTVFTYLPNSSVANVSLVINSASGSLLFYGFNLSYLGNNISVLTSGIPAGGVETVIVNNIDTSLDDTLFVTFFFNSVLGTETFFWNETLFLSDIIPANLTIESGLFDDLVALDRSNPIRGLVPFVIVVFLIIFLSAVSKSMTVGAIGGLAGLGIIWKFGFLPVNLVVVSIIVIVFIIVADVAGGGFR